MITRMFVSHRKLSMNWNKLPVPMMFVYGDEKNMFIVLL